MDREDILTIIEVAKQDKLKKLDLSNRDVCEIPPEIGQLIDLEELNLSYNSLTHLPDEISRLVNLHTLLLMRNNLEALPKSIGLLPKLKTLDISHNKLTSFPEEIGDLSELSTLDASYCKIERLPLEMVNLLSLKSLFLENNSLVFPGEKIVKRGLYATMHFLNEAKRNREASKVVLQAFSLPRDLQPAFKQYINCFNEVIASKSEKALEFDINFIDQDAELPQNIDLNAHMLDFVSFVKQHVASFQDESNNIRSDKFLDIQVADIKIQLNKLNSVLDSRHSEIISVQTELNRINTVIDKIKN